MTAPPPLRTCPVCDRAFETGDRCPDCGATLVGPRTDPLIGRMLKESYRIEVRIGAGGMGTVYRATQLPLGRPVAVKVLPPDIRDPDAIKRFFREAQIQSGLVHPNIASVIDFGNTAEGLMFMVVEYLDGHGLDQHVPAGGLAIGQASALMDQICAGVGAAHARGLVHRDLKPANIFVASMSDGTRMIKVLDFGLAKVKDDGTVQLTQTGLIMGSPGYIAPEQIGDTKAADSRSDVYALGAILFFMLTGEQTYAGTSARGIMTRQIMDPPDLTALDRKACPPRLRHLIASALEFDPALRPQSASELAQALRVFAPATSERRLVTLDEGGGPGDGGYPTASRRPTHITGERRAGEQRLPTSTTLADFDLPVLDLPGNAVSAEPRPTYAGRTPAGAEARETTTARARGASVPESAARESGSEPLHARPRRTSPVAVSVALLAMSISFAAVYMRRSSPDRTDEGSKTPSGMGSPSSGSHVGSETPPGSGSHGGSGSPPGSGSDPGSGSAATVGSGSDPAATAASAMGSAGYFARMLRDEYHRRYDQHPALRAAPPASLVLAEMLLERAALELRAGQDGLAAHSYLEAFRAFEAASAEAQQRVEATTHTALELERAAGEARERAVAAGTELSQLAGTPACKGIAVPEQAEALAAVADGDRERAGGAEGSARDAFERASATYARAIVQLERRRDERNRRLARHRVEADSARSGWNDAARRWMELAPLPAESTAADEAAQALLSRGRAAEASHDLDHAIAHYEEARQAWTALASAAGPRIAETLAGRLEAARSLLARCQTAYGPGRLPVPPELATYAAQLAPDAGAPPGTPVSPATVALAAMRLRDLAEAGEHAQVTRLLEAGQLVGRADREARLACASRCAPATDLPVPPGLDAAALPLSEAARVASTEPWTAIAELDRARALLDGAREAAIAAHDLAVNAAEQAGRRTLAARTEAGDKASPAAVALLGEADAHRAAKRFAAAIAAYEQATAQFARATTATPPTDRDAARAAQLALAEQARVAKDYAGAIAAYGAALELDPRCYDAYMGRAGCHFQQERYAQALLDFEQASAIDERKPIPWFERGRAYVRLGQSERALECLDKALELSPQYPSALIARGDLHRLAGKNGEAARDYETAALQAKTSWIPWYRLGETRRDLGEIGPALAAFEKALENTRDPNYRTLISDQIAKLKAWR